MINFSLFAKFTKVNILILILTLAIGILLGWALEKMFPNSFYHNSIITQLRTADVKYPLIKPLLACDVSENKQFLEYRPLKDTIVSATIDLKNSKKAAEISVYFRNLDNGEWTGINENAKYSPASMLKIAVMIAYYKLAETHPEILWEKVFYDGSFDLNQFQSIKSENFIKPGYLYTIDTLIKYMILYSDNNADKLLHLNINENSLKDAYSDLGVNIPEVGNIDFMSAKAYSRFFRIL